MKILVTGSEGFIGSNLYLHLESDLTQILRADRDKKYGVHLKQDLTQPWVINTDVDACIHLAGVSSVNAPIAVVEHNTKLMESVLVNCARLGIRTVAVASSSSVYGHQYVAQHEDMFCQPVSSYGWSKLLCENVCWEWAGKLGLHVISVRLFNAIGFKQRKNMLPWIATEAIDTGKTLPIYGNCLRAWTYVKDIALFFEHCVTTAQLLPVGHHVFNYGAEHSVSSLELIRLLEDATGSNARMRKEDPRPQDVKFTLPTMTKTYSVFGHTISPTTDLRPAVAEVISTYAHEKAGRAKSCTEYVHAVRQKFGQQ